MLVTLAVVQAFRASEVGFTFGPATDCPTSTPGTPTATNTPGGPTKTVTPTHTPCEGPTSTPTPCPIHTVPDPNSDGCIKVTQTNTPTPIPCPTDMVYDPYIHGCVPITPSSTPCTTGTGPDPVQGGCTPTKPTWTPTPCPTGKVFDSYYGSGCGTPTPAPTSNRPYGAYVTLISHSPSPPIIGQKKTWIFEIENVGSVYGCQPHEVTLNVQLTGVDSSALISSAMLGCHETDRITVSNIVTAQPDAVVSATYHAQAGAQPGNTHTITEYAVAASTPSGPPTPTRTRVPTPVRRWLGDFNCDGEVNAIDAVIILQIEAGMAIPLPCTGDADVNHDDELDALDALLILQYSAGLIAEFA